MTIEQMRYFRVACTSVNATKMQEDITSMIRANGSTFENTAKIDGMLKRNSNSLLIALMKGEI